MCEGRRSSPARWGMKDLAGAGMTLVLMAGPAPAADDLDRLSTFMQSVTDANGYLGAVTLIARDGEVVDWRAYGHRDLARRQPMPRDAIFRIYSMTKTVATVAALMLVDDGRLALDEPIARYLPEFTTMQVFDGGSADAPRLRPAASAITLRHLLTHSAGFATGGEGYEEATKILERADLHGSTDLADFARRASGLPLATDPGRRFHYDGTGIEVMGRLVEVVAGMPFETFVQRRVLDPLGMNDTGFSVPPSKRTRIADISSMGQDGRLVLDSGSTAARPGERMQRYASGAGGLYSTAPDYLRFCRMLLDGGRLEGRTLLRRETVRSMMRDELPIGMKTGRELTGGERFGFGGSVVVDPTLRDRRGSIGSFGWSGAASTYYTIDPQRHLIALLLMQHLPSEGMKNLPKISARFYDLVHEALDR